jgi:hypothetical protein
VFWAIEFQLVTSFACAATGTASATTAATPANRPSDAHLMFSPFAWPQRSVHRPLESIRHPSYLWEVAALSARDAERVLRFVAAAEERGGDEPFTPDVLGELGKLVEADGVEYCELDRVRRRGLHRVARTGDSTEPPVDLELDYWKLEDEDPVCSCWARNGDFRALKLSDFVSLRSCTSAGSTRFG